MEETGLAVLPRVDSDSDFEYGSICSSHNVSAIFGDAAEQNIANLAAVSRLRQCIAN